MCSRFNITGWHTVGRRGGRHGVKVLRSSNLWLHSHEIQKWEETVCGLTEGGNGCSFKSILRLGNVNGQVNSELPAIDLEGEI